LWAGSPIAIGADTATDGRAVRMWIFVNTLVINRPNYQHTCRVDIPIQRSLAESTGLVVESPWVPM